MNNIQKLGAYTSLVQGIAFVVLFVWALVLLPGLGIGIADVNNPAKLLPVASTFIFQMGNWLTILFSITVILVALAAYERLQAGSPWALRLAVSAAVVASALFLANGAIGASTVDLTALDVQNKAAAEAAFYAVNTVLNGLLNGAVIAASISALLWGWAARRQKNLPTLLAYFVMLAGVVGFVQIVVAPFVLLLFVLNIAWSLWLGIVLLQTPK
jgi:hypothetical protein